MSNGEEERRREKIIRDSQVASAAMRDQRRCLRGEYTPEQERALLDLDDEWLERREGIVGEGR